MKNKRKEELNGKWKQVATKAVTDDDFRKKLAKNPLTVMKEFELELPEGIEARLEAGYEIKLFTQLRGCGRVAGRSQMVENPGRHDPRVRPGR